MNDNEYKKKYIKYKIKYLNFNNKIELNKVGGTARATFGDTARAAFCSTFRNQMTTDQYKKWCSQYTTLENSTQASKKNSITSLHQLAVKLPIENKGKLVDAKNQPEVLSPSAEKLHIISEDTGKLFDAKNQPNELSYIIVPGNAEKPGGAAVRFNLSTYYNDFKQHFKKLINNDVDSVFNEILILFYEYINNNINSNKSDNTKLKTLILKQYSDSSLNITEIINKMIIFILSTVIYNLKYSICNTPLEEQIMEYIWGFKSQNENGTITYDTIYKQLSDNIDKFEDIMDKELKYINSLREPDDKDKIVKFKEYINLLENPEGEMATLLLKKREEINTEKKKLLKEILKNFFKSIPQNELNEDIYQDIYDKYKENIKYKNIYGLYNVSHSKKSCTAHNKNITNIYNKLNDLFFQIRDTNSRDTARRLLKQTRKLFDGGTLMNNKQIQQCLKIIFSWGRLNSNDYYTIQKINDYKTNKKPEKYNECFIMKNDDNATLLFTFTPNYADRDDYFPVTHIEKYDIIEQRNDKDEMNAFYFYNKQCLQYAYTSCIEKIIEDLSTSDKHKDKCKCSVYIPRIGDGLYKAYLGPQSKHKEKLKELVYSVIKSCIDSYKKKGIIESIVVDGTINRIKFKTKLVNVKFIYFNSS